MRTREFFGRSRENANPVPPEAWWISAALCIVMKMALRSSSMGRTKHAAHWSPFSVPAFMSVGEFGMNWPRTISL